MAHDVFISYSSKDKPIADAVCANLEAAGLRCWIAPRDIAPGEDWPTAIAEAIPQSRVMVLVFSANSNASDDVGRELILASNNKLVIIPFKIENVEPVPGKQYYLARTHWLDAMNPPTQGQIDVLVRRVATILPATGPDGGTAPVRAPEISPRYSPLPSRRRMSPLLWIAGALLVAAVIAAAAYFGLARKRPAAPASAGSTPAATQVVASPTATPVPFLFSANFQDPASDGSFDANVWLPGPKPADFSFRQTNGAMVISKPVRSASQNGTLGTMRTWSPGEFSYVEARLMLDHVFSGDNGNTALTLSDPNSWWAGCGLQIAYPTPYIWCGQSGASPQDNFEAMSNSYPAGYDQWYTLRIAFDRQTGEFHCFINGVHFFSWQPANGSAVVAKKLRATIGIWTDANTTLTGYFDDVRVVK